MKKLLQSSLLLITTLIFSIVGWGQYTVDFEGASIESGSTGYALGVYKLNGIDWEIGSDALIGTAGNDIKNDNAAARIRNIGSTITMIEDKPNGIGTISFLYSRSNFSGDRSGTAPSFVVEYSTNQGSSWTQVGSETSLAGIDDLTSFSATANVAGDARIRIRQTAGANGKRWNVDDIVITDFIGTSDTEVQFANATGSVPENGGTFDLVLEIANEDAAATSVEVALTSGDASDIDGYTTQTVTFPSSSSANQTLTLTITDNMIADGDRDLTFTLQNPSGGNNAQIGAQSTFVLTIIDDELPSASIPYSEDFSDCATQEWSVFTVGAEEEWSCNANGYFEANAFGSSGPADDYLVSPVFDMDAQTDEAITFTSWTRFSDTTYPPISLLYTDDFTGDPATTTWNSLSPTWSPENSQESTPSGTIDVSFITGTSVVFAFRYTSSGTGGGSTSWWRIEDFNLFENVADEDTEVFTAIPQVAASTQTAADVTSVANSFAVLGFEIEDQGTADGLPTEVSRMRFVPGPNNTADWSGHIQGLTLDDISTSYTPSSVSITDTEILLDFSPAITIADGTGVEFELGVYLNTSNVIDGAVLQFQIDAASSGFLSEVSGSGFADPFLLGDVVGNNHTINVDATQLTYITQPTDVFLGSAISPAVQVAYTDVNGLIDTDYDGTGFEISLTTTGSFDAASTTTETASNGVATFTNLVFDALDTGIILTAIDDSSFISGSFNSNTFDVNPVPTEGLQVTATDTAFIIDFDATIAGVNEGQFDGSGFTPTPATGQLHSNAWAATGFSDGDLEFGGTETTGDFARGVSTGGVTTGGIYAFEVATGNVGLGVQPIGADFTPGSFTLKVQNQTGETITDVDLSYLVYVYNDQERANSFNFSYSEDDTTYIPVTALDLTSPEAADAVPEWVSNPRSTSLTGLSLNDGEFLYLRWTGDDVSGGGSRDEFALDDISVTFLPPSVTFVYDDGSWTPNDPIAGPILSRDVDDVEVLSGTAVLSGELIANNLTIEAGATLEMAAPTSTLSADASFINLAGDIINNGNLTFKSDANGSAQLGVFNGTITGSGEVTTERFVPAADNIDGSNLGRAFRFLTSTVTTTTSIRDNWQEGVNNTGTNFPTDNQNPNPGYGIHITGSTTGANGFDATGTGAPSMFAFNNATTNWVEIDNTDTETLLAGRAYRTFVRGDRSINVTLNSATPTNTTLRSTGQLRTGTVNYGSDVDALSAAPLQVSMVANPYQAVVDYGAVSRSNLTNFIAVWDASINDRGAYVSVDITDSSNNNASSDASRYLAPGQAFFVRNGFGAGSITFEEDDKVTDETQVTVFNTNTDFKISSSLYRTENLLTNGKVSDGLVLAFNDNYTTEAGIEDAEKIANPDENYAVINNGLQAIDKQAMPSIGHEINLFISGYRDTNYSLTFAIQHQPEGLGVFLQDAYLQTQVELTADFSYDFSIDENIPASIASNRFSLHFDTTTLSVESNEFDIAFSIYPNPAREGKFSIQSHAFDADELSVAIYNMIGQQVFTQKLSVENNGIIKVDAPQLSAGVYLVELSQDGQRFTQKLIVE